MIKNASTYWFLLSYGTVLFVFLFFTFIFLILYIFRNFLSGFSEICIYSEQLVYIKKKIVETSKSKPWIGSYVEK